jgi:KAP-like P-loop domain-containing protein
MKSSLVMSSRKKSNGVRQWWVRAGRKFLQAQWRRMGLGCIIGGLIGTGVHLLTHDSGSGSYLHQEWSDLSISQRFDGFRAYRPELVILFIGIVAVAVIPTSLWAWRYVRSWWAGIVSIMMWAAVCATFAALKYGLNYPKIAAAGGVASLATVLATEYWRQSSKRSQSAIQHVKLNIPITKSNVSAEQRWKASSSDDPISEWADDIIGRTAVVELLAEHSLRLRTPIVALHGGLGDGKSSVLNLLRKAVEGQAIVISFSAWLPGSEATLATDLFKDIATECRKHVYVPQLRKQALAYARTLSGSVSYLAGLKELLPTQSQREEVQELREAFSRMPMPIFVLLDEIDRMQKEELLVLLKILRGAASIPNVTFVCAFSEEEIKRELSKDGSLSSDYLEKYFPVSVSLSAPDPDMLGRCFQARLRAGLDEQKWFRAEQYATKFAELLERIWQDALYRVCTNLRKAGLLLNDILTAARPIIGEVNPFDLLAIEAIRRFYPEIYRLVRTNPLYLTYARNSWTKGQVLTEERKEKESKELFKTLNDKIEKSNEPAVVRALLSWLFPEYVRASGERLSVYQLIRPTNEGIAENEQRICSADYFPIYFRAAVSEEMFSNAELDRLISDLNKARTDPEVQSVFNQMLDSIPPKHPKREDFLWKLSRESDRLDDVTAERLAYAAAARADSYAYDIINLGEAARALNIVFTAAQKLSAKPIVQRILEGSTARASDDTFARRILEYTENKGRNKILTDFSNVDVAAVKRAFMVRMRRRYGRDKTVQTVNIAQGDWWAFRLWVEDSGEDREIEQDFWRRFIGRSRKRLAQAINFVFPSNVAWEQDPSPTVNSMFPMEQFAALLKELPDDEKLDEAEEKGITRMQELLAGKYPKPFQELQT